MSQCTPVQPMLAKEAYRLWAPNYDSTPNPLLSLEHRTLVPMISAATGCDVVDLGCGTGRWLAQLDKTGARSICGVDASNEMLQQAANKLTSSTQLIQADCQRTPLPAASYDWIQASFLLSYLPDLHAFACEAARIARPSAFVLISDVHPATRQYGWKRTFSSAHQLIEIQTHSYQICDLHVAMDRAGFDPTLFLELPFGDQEKAIYFDAGRPDLFERVEGLPVLFVAGYRRRN